MVVWNEGSKESRPITAIVILKGWEFEVCSGQKSPRVDFRNPQKRLEPGVVALRALSEAYREELDS